jgi:hypothetical protein
MVSVVEQLMGEEQAILDIDDDESRTRGKFDRHGSV